MQDPEWGPAFLKFGTYVPYPIKLCLNGHEWVKPQLGRAEVAFDSLDNGFLACADPTRLQAICDRLGPADVQAFFDRWAARLPAPMTATDRVGLLFPHRITRKTPPPAWGYRTRVITDGVEPSLHIEYKASHVKQDFKEQRALRTETTINNLNDFYVAKAVPNLAHLRDLGDQVNRKALPICRAASGTAISARTSRRSSVGRTPPPK